MFKYYIRFNKNDIILENKKKNIWSNSNNYYGSSTRSGYPVACYTKDDKVNYNSISFSLIKVNNENPNERDIVEYIVIDDVVKECFTFQGDLSKPKPLTVKMKLQIKNIGYITFSFRELYRWEGRPYEIGSIKLELN